MKRLNMLEKKQLSYLIMLVLLLPSLSLLPACAAEIVPPAAGLPSLSSEILPAAIAQRLGLPVRASLTARKIDEAISTVYEGRKFSPIFVTNEGFTPDGARLVKRLEQARYDGLDPKDYSNPLFARLTAASSADDKAAAELALSRAVLLYARHAMGGRADIAKLHPNVFAKRPEPDLVGLLKDMEAGRNPVALLEAQNPPHAQFLLLRRMLGKLIDERDAKGADSKSLAAIDELIINMERWRWLPRVLGPSFVMVSVPEYTVRIIDAGKTTYQGRVIVGQQKTPTPLFSAEMQYIVVNPTWTVPPGILKNEILPLYNRNPEAVARLGLEVVRQKGGNITFRQAPGERNALGRVKFMFPNDYSIYLHDTPSRGLFTRAQRALSHGCVRVDQPLKFADVLFEHEEGLDGRRIEQLYGKGERHVRLKRRIPVHLTYFTVSPGNDGQLTQHADIYGLDKKMKQVLGL